MLVYNDHLKGNLQPQKSPELFVLAPMNLMCEATICTATPNLYTYERQTEGAELSNTSSLDTCLLPNYQLNHSLLYPTSNGLERRKPCAIRKREARPF